MNWRFYTSRLIAGVLGVVLLSAAFMKMTDMNLFIRQMKDYGVISDYLLLSIAGHGLIAVECALGAALIFFYRPRFTLTVTLFVTVIFVGVSGWAWLTRATADCGCFGAWVKRTPKQAAFEGLIMLALALTAWILSGRKEPRIRYRVVPVMVVAAFLAGLALPLAFGSRLTGPEPDRGRPGEEFAGGVLKPEGLDGIDLRQGDYLVVLMDTDCSHCRQAVAQLNRLSETPDLPGIIALSSKEEDQINAFEDELQALFPIGRITEEEFWRLLGDGNVPRTLLVRDHVVKRVWDVEIPDEDTVRSIIEKEAIFHPGNRALLSGLPDEKNAVGSPQVGK